MGRSSRGTPLGILNPNRVSWAAPGAAARPVLVAVTDAAPAFTGLLGRDPSRRSLAPDTASSALVSPVSLAGPATPGPWEEGG